MERQKLVRAALVTLRRPLLQPIELPSIAHYLLYSPVNKTIYIELHKTSRISALAHLFDASAIEAKPMNARSRMRLLLHTEHVIELGDFTTGGRGRRNDLRIVPVSM